MEQGWYYQTQSMVSINARGVQRGWLSKAEIRDAGLKDKTPAGALGSGSGECMCGCVCQWVDVCELVGGCVRAGGWLGGCLHGCVNEEVISGVNAWQRAKRWPLQGGNRKKREGTIKTRMRSSKGRGGNKVKAIRKKRGQEDSGTEGRKRCRTGLVCDEDSPTHGFD